MYKKYILIMLISALFYGCTAETGGNDKDLASLDINKTQMGDKWPFTVSKASLTCIKDEDIKSPLVKINGQWFGLTGFADAKYGQNDIKALDRYWAENPNVKGLMQNLSPVTEKALELCK